MARIISVATKEGSTTVNRVGTLYALLGAVFGSEQLLAQKAASGDAWYAMVNHLAADGRGLTAWTGFIFLMGIQAGLGRQPRVCP